MYKKVLIGFNRLRSKDSTIFRAGIATVDQLLLSLLNFLISFILIKFVSQEEYGLYSIVFPLTLFFVAIQNAVVTTPLAVLYYNKSPEKREPYIASLYSGQLLFVIIIIVFFVLTSLFILVFTSASYLSITFISVTVASIGILIREFIRSSYFTQEQPLLVLKIDLMFTIYFILLFIFLFATGFITVYNSLIIMGVASIFSCYKYFKVHNDKFNKEKTKESYKENWIYGRWALVGVVLTHIQTYSYIYLIGIFLGAQSAAIVAAARFLLTPLALFQSGWMKIAIPQGSKLYESGKLNQFVQELIRSSIIYALVTLVYTIFLFFASNKILDILLDDRYLNSLDFIWYWMIISVIGFTATNASFGLQVLKRFKFLSTVNAFTLIITLGSCLLLIPSLREKGALIALILGGINYMIPLWYQLIKLKKNHYKKITF